MKAETEVSTAKKKDPLSMMEQIVCIMLPIVGIVLYFIFISKDEPKAKFALQLAVFGIVLGLVGWYLLLN